MRDGNDSDEESFKKIIIRTSENKVKEFNKYDKHFQVELFLDLQYPFQSPQVHMLTKFTSVIDLYDGRDIYKEVMSGKEWRVATNLHEIIISLPDFIENTKQQEDQALEQHEIHEAKNLLTNQQNQPILTEIYGQYVLENTYDLGLFSLTQDDDGNILPGPFSSTSSLYNCLEQGE